MFANLSLFYLLIFNSFLERNGQVGLLKSWRWWALAESGGSVFDLAEVWGRSNITS